MKNQEREQPREHRDPQPEHQDEKEIREAAHDKTLADSFPTSDPPSTIPDPADETTPGADTSITHDDEA